MEVWDFLDRSHEASMITRINSGAIAALKFWPHTAPNQQLLEVGDASGRE